MAVANALAYFNKVTTTKAKSFIALALALPVTMAD
jgi:hypothetical protein